MYYMCFTTASSFIYCNDMLKLIILFEMWQSFFVNEWGMHWLYCVYNIPVYNIENSYSGGIELLLFYHPVGPLI